MAGSKRRIWLAWGMLGGFFSGLAALLLYYGAHFAPEVEAIDMPSLPLVAGLVAAGLMFLLALPLIRKSIAAGLGGDRRLLWLILGFGLVFRLILFASTPAFETDWNRYLWDGGVAAHGYNPYAASPDDAQGESYYYSLQPLAQQSGVVIERVNHSHLKTVYPPVAEAAFALAHIIRPWSLEAWRALLLGAEVVTLGLLLVLLKEAGLAPIWVALYWWNPIPVKEIINTAHMEAITTPFVLGALLLTLRQRHLMAATSLGLAIGTKLWPVMLAPLVLRPLLSSPRRLVAAMAIIAGLTALWVWPIIAGGVDETSGFVAFATKWRSNSALFPMLESGAKTLLAGLDLAATTPGVIMRAILAGCVGLIALWISKRDTADAQDLMTRAGIVTAALYLLSPAQFPWYAIWMLPFVCFQPRLSLLAVTTLVPIYYASFYFIARDTHDVFRTWVVWVIWVPIWVLLAAEAFGWHRSRANPAATLDGRHA